MLLSLNSRCRGSNLHAGSHWIVLERLIGACCLCVLSFHLISHQVLMLFGVGGFFFFLYWVYFLYFYFFVIGKSNGFWLSLIDNSSFSNWLIVWFCLQFVSVCTLLNNVWKWLSHISPFWMGNSSWSVFFRLFQLSQNWFVFTDFSIIVSVLCFFGSECMFVLF